MDRIVKDRKNKLNLLWQFAPKWINKPINRLPCVILLETGNLEKDKEFKKFKIEIKHFEKENKSRRD